MRACDNPDCVEVAGGFLGDLTCMVVTVWGVSSRVLSAAGGWSVGGANTPQGPSFLEGVLFIRRVRG